MKYSRRDFIQQAGQTAAASAILGYSSIFSSFGKQQSAAKPLNPWIELSKASYLKNAEVISQMASGNPVLAVLKNNAYGLGDIEVGKILDSSSHISGIALVKDERALALRHAGVKKNILLMADFDERLGTELIRSRIRLSIHSHESFQKIKTLSTAAKSPVDIELYIDTGLGRMGIPYHKAKGLIRKVAAEKMLNIVGSFTTLTSPHDFANEQLRRFKQLLDDVKKQGIQTGKHHAAPSSSLLDIQASHLDLVRPGILLHGTFPSANSSAQQDYKLHPTYRLKAGIMRVEQLRKGDSVGFSRFYTAQKDEWIATLPIGWADGYDSGSENGAKVLVGNKLYPVINVNASHCNLLLGQEKEIRVGDTATLIGPDLPEITPAGFARSINGHHYLQIQYKESIPKYVQDRFE